MLQQERTPHVEAAVSPGAFWAPKCRHIPHGFYEKQLKGAQAGPRCCGCRCRRRRRRQPCLPAPGPWPLTHRPTVAPPPVAEYFSQFGKVTKVRLSRSKKSGKSKHYAFLEFASPEVAAIASEAMDGYMLFTQKLSSRVLPAEEVHPDLFKGANRVFKQVGAAAPPGGCGPRAGWPRCMGTLLHPCGGSGPRVLQRRRHAGANSQHGRPCLSARMPRRMLCRPPPLCARDALPPHAWPPACHADALGQDRARAAEQGPHARGGGEAAAAGGGARPSAAAADSAGGTPPACCLHAASVCSELGMPKRGGSRGAQRRGAWHVWRCCRRARCLPAGGMRRVGERPQRHAPRCANSHVTCRPPTPAPLTRLALSTSTPGWRGRCRRRPRRQSSTTEAGDEARSVPRRCAHAPPACVTPALCPARSALICTRPSSCTADAPCCPSPAPLCFCSASTSWPAEPRRHSASLLAPHRCQAQQGEVGNDVLQ